MAKKLSMYDSFEYRGFWWKPNNPDKRVAGILTYSMEGINLELFDTLSSVHNTYGMDAQKYDFVLGECDGNKTITLYDGFETKLKMSGIVTSKLTFNKMLIGSHYESVEEMNFHSVSVNYSHIEEWMRYNPFEEIYEFDEGQKLKRFGTTYRFPPIFEAYVESLEATIKANYHFNTDGEMFKTKIFQHIGSLQIIPNENKGLEWFLENIHELQDLLSLLSNRAIYPKRIEFKGDIINSEKNIREKIELYLLPMEEYKEKKIHPAELFIDYKKIEGKIQTVINNWFKKEINSPKKIYLRNIYDAGADWETKFLNYAKAIESYHRETSGDAGKFLSDADYEPIKGIMLESIPANTEAGFRSKLASTLAYAHHHGFERRVRDTLRDLDEDVRGIIFESNQKMKAFAGDVTKSRDYYTHFGDKPEYLLKDWGLYFANIRLHTVLFYELCIYLDVDRDIVCQAIKDDFNLIQKLETAKQELPN
ncbi:HEPN domain-containing protein [Paenibacillus tarimensis]